MASLSWSAMVRDGGVPSVGSLCCDAACLAVWVTSEGGNWVRASARCVVPPGSPIAASSAVGFPGLCVACPWRAASRWGSVPTRFWCPCSSVRVENPRVSCQVGGCPDSDRSWLIGSSVRPGPEARTSRA